MYAGRNCVHVNSSACIKESEAEFFKCQSYLSVGMCVCVLLCADSAHKHLQHVTQANSTFQQTSAPLHHQDPVQQHMAQKSVQGK